jgi:hypothetical protein
MKKQTRMNKASELAKKGLAVSAVAIAGMGYSLKQYEDAEDAAMGLRCIYDASQWASKGIWRNQ